MLVVDKASGKLEISNGVIGRMDLLLLPLVSSHSHTCRVYTKSITFILD